ncbi:hypothetical protein F4780DRAFT_795170 [Xylariomycetidae sp. FL0641]|nr:hypothetical protein F4780DRAFT_795170 [Xylariomycetidae sp. FL0641]
MATTRPEDASDAQRTTASASAPQREQVAPSMPKPAPAHAKRPRATEDEQEALLLRRRRQRPRAGHEDEAAVLRRPGGGPRENEQPLTEALRRWHARAGALMQQQIELNELLYTQALNLRLSRVCDELIHDLTQAREQQQPPPPPPQQHRPLRVGGTEFEVRFRFEDNHVRMMQQVLETLLEVIGVSIFFFVFSSFVFELWDATEMLYWWLRQ